MDQEVNSQVPEMPIVEQPVQPALFNQEQVNKMIGREKMSARDAGRREAEAQYQKELEALRGSQQQRNAEVPRDIDANAIYQQVQEKWNAEMQERQMKEHMQVVANKHLQNVEKAKMKYQDFSDVVKNFDASKFPQLTYLVANMEGGDEILYDLSKNPDKIAQLSYTAERDPELAQTILLKLSKSILNNKQAIAEAQEQNVNEPLDRITPSRIAGNNGKMGIRDLRNQPWLRG
jgi:hypothetical protein